MQALGHIVVLGAGHAGGRVVQNLRELGYLGKITLIGDESHAPYERPALSKEILLDVQEIHSLTLGPDEFWNQADACDRIIARVERVHAGARALTLDNGQTLEFDSLVIATGGKARTLGLPGTALPGVHTLRTIDDSLALKQAFGAGRRLVVIGAGVIGMEVASSAIASGMQVTVLENSGRVVSRCLPAAASFWLEQEHRRHGVALDMQVKVLGIEASNEDSPLLVRASDAEHAEQVYPADLVLLAVGIDCELGYLEGSGIPVDNGVVVDEFCRVPGMPWVYAAGDVAKTPNRFMQGSFRQETWRNAEHQARAVAEFLLINRVEPYIELPWMWTDQLGHNIQVVGIPREDDEIVERGTLEDGSGSLLWLRDGLLAGGVLVNNSRDRKALETLVQQGARLDAETLQADSKRRLKDFL